MGKFSKKDITWMVLFSILVSPIVAYRWLEEKIKNFFQISDDDSDPHDNF